MPETWREEEILGIRIVANDPTTSLDGFGAVAWLQRASSLPGCESRILAWRGERPRASDLQEGTWPPRRACHTRPSPRRRGPEGVRKDRVSVVGGQGSSS